MVDGENSDYDSPWKEIIEYFFADFLEFYFEDVAALIDWRHKPIFLDKELQKIHKDADEGRKYVDKLVRVVMLDGREEWLLIHIEFQSDRDDQLPYRIFVYHYRIFDFFGREVISLAVLGDLDEGWKPNHFGYSRGGCSLNLTFPVAKLIEIEEDMDLERERNPFALATAAHLHAKRTRHEQEVRKAGKLKLYRLALKKGYNREDIRQLLRFIEWVVDLPENLDDELIQTLRVEERSTMKYIPTWERKSRAEGIRQGKQELFMSLLENRFGPLPEWARMKAAAADSDTLERLSPGILTKSSLEDVLAPIPSTAKRNRK